MEISATYKFAAPPQAVWTLLMDPAAIKSCLPGCKELRPVGDNRSRLCGLVECRCAEQREPEVRYPPQHRLELRLVADRPDQLRRSMCPFEGHPVERGPDAVAELSLDREPVHATCHVFEDGVPISSQTAERTIHIGDSVYPAI